MLMYEINIPASIKIGGFDYRIEKSESHNKELQEDNCWGEHSEKQRRIWFDSSASPQQISQTFIHEIIHAVDAVYQGRKLTEDSIHAVANGLLQVLEQLGIRFICSQGEKNESA